MKIIRNNICYVEKEDKDFAYLLNGKSEFKEARLRSVTNTFDFLVFKDEDAIAFFKNQDFILNYDDVKDLSLEELEKLTVQKEIEILSYNDSINNKKSQYYYDSLLKYIAKKEKYVEEASYLSKPGIKRVRLDYRSAVTTTAPVDVITVSGAELAKLDRGIAAKVSQNITMRTRNDEALAKYDKLYYTSPKKTYVKKNSH